VNGVAVPAADAARGPVIERRPAAHAVDVAALLSSASAVLGWHSGSNTHDNAPRHEAADLIVVKHPG
jgi:hypothetical protein